MPRLCEFCQILSRAPYHKAGRCKALVNFLRQFSAVEATPKQNPGMKDIWYIYIISIFIQFHKWSNIMTFNEFQSYCIDETKKFGSWEYIDGKSACSIFNLPLIGYPTTSNRDNGDSGWSKKATLSWYLSKQPLERVWLTVLQRWWMSSSCFF